MARSSTSLRNDYTTRFAARGQHTTKIGGEWLHQWGPYFQCTNCMGTIDAGNRLPPADLEQLFPDIMDVSTWNLAALGLVRFYQVGISAVGFEQKTPKEIVAAWIQDDWQVTSRLTVNLGLRYDISKGQFAERRGVGPWVQAGRPIEKDRFGPRFGFAYALNDRTVIRGGSGKYFADVSDQVSSWTERYGTGEINAQVAYDGRANFSADPWNGRGQPTYEQALLIPGLRKSVSQIATPGLQVPYSYQTSIGFQRQLRSDMGVEADYVYNASRAELFQMNINLTYDPVTGVLNPSTNAALAVRPDWGTVNAYHSQGWSNYHALQTAFTKRFNQRWQLSGTYTLSAFWDGTPSPAPQINLVEDLGRQVLVGRHGPAPPRRRQRHLGCGTRPAVERPLLLRIGSARRNHLRRRRSSQTAHGWPAGGHHCSAEQPRGRLASPGGSPDPATREAPGPYGSGWNC